MDDVRGVGRRGGKKAGLKIEIEFTWGFERRVHSTVSNPKF
jgi:hypothetical protein